MEKMSMDIKEEKNTVIINFVGDAESLKRLIEKVLKPFEEEKVKIKAKLSLKLEVNNVK